MNAKLFLKFIESNYNQAFFIADFGRVANSRGFGLSYDGDKDEFILVRGNKELGRIKFEKDLVKVIVNNEVEVFKGEGIELIDQVLKFISRKSL